MSNIFFPSYLKLRRENKWLKVVLLNQGVVRGFHSREKIHSNTCVPKFVLNGTKLDNMKVRK